MKDDRIMQKEAVFNHEKMFTYIRGFASGAKLENTEAALIFAREKHMEQKRKSGEPYITHPLTMACYAMSLGVRSDEVLSACLLHDVVEDCDVTLESLPVSDRIKHSVDLLTFVKINERDEKTAKAIYYNKILNDRTATIVKLIDRYHNVSTMGGIFTKEKIFEYIEETKEFVLPMLEKATLKYPNDSNLFFILKYNIMSMINSLEAAINAYTK